MIAAMIAWLEQGWPVLVFGVAMLFLALDGWLRAREWWRGPPRAYCGPSGPSVEMTPEIMVNPRPTAVRPPPRSRCRRAPVHAARPSPVTPGGTLDPSTLAALKALFPGASP